MSTSYRVIHRPLAKYVRLRAAHASGKPGTFSLPPRVSDPDMHYGTCVTHVPWCLSVSLTSYFLWSPGRGKRSRHSWRMRNPQFYVSGNRPICGSIPWSIAHCILKAPHRNFLLPNGHSIELVMMTVGFIILRQIFFFKMFFEPLENILYHRAEFRLYHGDCHDMETLCTYTLLALTLYWMFPTQVQWCTASKFVVVVSLNKLLNQRPSCRWLETQ